MDCNNFFTTDALGFDSNLDSLIQADYDEEIALPFSSHSQLSTHMNDRVDLSVSGGLGIVDTSSEMKVNPEEVAEMGCDDLDEIPSNILNLNQDLQENASKKCEDSFTTLTKMTDKGDNKLPGNAAINIENAQRKKDEILEINFNELDEMPSDLLDTHQGSDKNTTKNELFCVRRTNLGETKEVNNENVTQIEQNYKKIEQSTQLVKEENEVIKVFNKDVEIDPVVEIDPECINPSEIQTDIVNVNSISEEKSHLISVSSQSEIKDKFSTEKDIQKDIDNLERSKTIVSENLRINKSDNTFNKIEDLDIEILREKRKTKLSINICKEDSSSKDKNLVYFQNQLDRSKKRKHNELTDNLNISEKSNKEDLHFKKIKITELVYKDQEKAIDQNKQIEMNKTLTEQQQDQNEEKIYTTDQKIDDIESESSIDTDSNSQFVIMEEYADEDNEESDTEIEDFAEQGTIESDKESLTENKNPDMDSKQERCVEYDIAETTSVKESCAKKYDSDKDVNEHLLPKETGVASESDRESYTEKEHTGNKLEGERVKDNCQDITEVLEVQESDKESLAENENETAWSDVESVVDNSGNIVEDLEAHESARESANEAQETDGESATEEPGSAGESADEAQESSVESATKAQESAGETANEEVDEDEDTLVEDDFEDMDDFEVIDADYDDDDADEADVDEAGNNEEDDDDDDDDVLDEAELDAWLEESVDKQDKNRTKGPGQVQSREQLGNGNYVMRTKHVLKEKGKNPFEILPEGWLAITHNSGMPVYLHKKSRVCTLSKPYFIGKSSARKHQTPISAIPCLQYRRELDKENQAGEESNTTRSQDNSNDVTKTTENPNTATPPPQNGPLEAHKDIPKPIVTTAEGSERTIGVEDLHQYCKALFEFQDIKVRQFRTWEEKRSHMRKRYQNSKILLPKMCGDTRLIVCPIPEAANKGLTKKRKEFIMNPLNKSPICVLHEYTQHIIKTQPKYTFSEVDNQQNSYKSTITIDGMVYGTGLGFSKKKAKAEAAKKALDVFIPQLSDFWKDSEVKVTTDDLSYFEEVAIEDPRVMHLCDKAALPKPFQILNECLKRNFGLGDTTLKMDKNLIANQKTEFTLTVGKHKVAVHCKNKKEGRQLASQAMLQKLHPHLKSWASILRLYSKSTELGFQEREEEIPQKTSVKNFDLLEKLKDAMRNTRLKKGQCNDSNFVESQNTDHILDL